MTQATDLDRPTPGWGPLLTLLVMPLLVIVVVIKAIRPLSLSSTLALCLLLAVWDGVSLLYYSALAKIRAWPPLRDRFTPVSRNVLLIAIAAAIGMKSLLAGLAELLAAGGVVFQNPAANPLLATAPADLAITMPIVVILGPIWEELLFRGVLIDRLRPHTSIGGAIFISSLLFALAHDNQFALGMIGIMYFSGRFALGVGAALLALRYRSLMPAFLFHAASNLLAELF
jgi:membrane protease YdiL (CAAX protease family)